MVRPDDLKEYFDNARRWEQDLLLTAQRSVMGDFVSSLKVRIAAGGGALVVLCLNFVLLAQAFGLPIPFLQA